MSELNLIHSVSIELCIKQTLKGKRNQIVAVEYWKKYGVMREYVLVFHLYMDSII